MMHPANPGNEPSISQESAASILENELFCKIPLDIAPAVAICLAWIEGVDNDSDQCSYEAKSLGLGWRDVCYDYARKMNERDSAVVSEMGGRFTPVMLLHKGKEPCEPGEESMGSLNICSENHRESTPYISHYSLENELLRFLKLEATAAPGDEPTDDATKFLATFESIVEILSSHIDSAEKDGDAVFRNLRKHLEHCWEKRIVALPKDKVPKEAVPLSHFGKGPSHHPLENILPLVSLSDGKTVKFDYAPRSESGEFLKCNALLRAATELTTSMVRGNHRVMKALMKYSGLVPTLCGNALTRPGQENALKVADWNDADEAFLRMKWHCTVICPNSMSNETWKEVVKGAKHFSSESAAEIGRLGMNLQLSTDYVPLSKLKQLIKTPAELEGGEPQGEVSEILSAIASGKSSEITACLQKANNPSPKKETLKIVATLLGIDLEKSRAYQSLAKLCDEEDDKQEKAKETNKIKKPRSAYNFYVQARHAANEADDLEFKDLSKLFAEGYKALSKDKKKKYDDMAAEDRNRYNKEILVNKGSEETATAPLYLRKGTMLEMLKENVIIGDPAELAVYVTAFASLFLGGSPKHGTPILSCLNSHASGARHTFVRPNMVPLESGTAKKKVGHSDWSNSDIVDSNARTADFSEEMQWKKADEEEERKMNKGDDSTCSQGIHSTRNSTNSAEVDEDYVQEPQDGSDDDDDSDEDENDRNPKPAEPTSGQSDLSARSSNREHSAACMLPVAGSEKQCAFLASDTGLGWKSNGGSLKELTIVFQVIFEPLLKMLKEFSSVEFGSKEVPWYAPYKDIPVKRTHDFSLLSPASVPSDVILSNNGEVPSPLPGGNPRSGEATESKATDIPEELLKKRTFFNRAMSMLLGVELPLAIINLVNKIGTDSTFLNEHLPHLLKNTAHAFPPGLESPTFRFLFIIFSFVEDNKQAKVFGMETVKAFVRDRALLYLRLWMSSSSEDMSDDADVESYKDALERGDYQRFNLLSNMYVQGLKRLPQSFWDREDNGGDGAALVETLKESRKKALAKERRRTKKGADKKAKREADKKAKGEAEEKAKKEAEEKAKKEAEEKAKREAEEGEDNNMEIEGEQSQSLIEQTSHEQRGVDGSQPTSPVVHPTSQPETENDSPNVVKAILQRSEAKLMGSGEDEPYQPHTKMLPCNPNMVIWEGCSVPIRQCVHEGEASPALLSEHEDIARCKALQRDEVDDDPIRVAAAMAMFQCKKCCGMYLEATSHVFQEKKLVAGEVLSRILPETGIPQWMFAEDDMKQFRSDFLVFAGPHSPAFDSFLLGIYLASRENNGGLLPCGAKIGQEGHLSPIPMSPLNVSTEAIALWRQVSGTSHPSTFFPPLKCAGYGCNVGASSIMPSMGMMGLTQHLLDLIPTCHLDEVLQDFLIILRCTSWEPFHNTWHLYCQKMFVRFSTALTERLRDAGSSQLPLFLHTLLMFMSPLEAKSFHEKVLNNMPFESTVNQVLEKADEWRQAGQQVSDKDVTPTNSAQKKPAETSSEVVSSAQKQPIDGKEDPRSTTSSVLLETNSAQKAEMQAQDGGVSRGNESIGGKSSSPRRGGRTSSKTTSSTKRHRADLSSEKKRKKDKKRKGSSSEKVEKKGKRRKKEKKEKKEKTTEEEEGDLGSFPGIE